MVDPQSSTILAQKRGLTVRLFAGREYPART
jgi:hypothetical protein